MSDPNSSLMSLSAPSEAAHVNFGPAGVAALKVSHFFMVGRLLTQCPNVAGLMGTMPSIWRQRTGLQFHFEGDRFVFQFDREANRNKKIRLSMDTRQRYRFYRNYQFDSMNVDVEIVYEKIQGLCKACGLFQHVVEGYDKLFVREKEALHGLRVAVMEGLTIAKLKEPRGSFLGPKVSSKAKKNKEEALQLAAKVKALVRVQPPEKHLLVDENLTAWVLKAC
ncbi:hypothetical protein ACLB2K_029500 [Fragaria x ananassa]